MQTTVTNIKTEEKVRKKPALKKAKIKKMKIFDVSAGRMIEFTPSDWLIEELKKSEEEIKAGKGIKFNSIDEAKAYVEKLIENDKSGK